MWTPGEWTVAYTALNEDGSGKAMIGDKPFMKIDYERREDVEIAIMAPDMAMAIMGYVAAQDEDRGDQGATLQMLLIDGWLREMSGRSA